MTTIRFIDCDEDLRARIGEVLGPVAERHVCLVGGFTLVAVEGKTPVGLLAVQERQLPEPLKNVTEGFINIIEVDKGHRRQGLGRQLVEGAMSRCRQLGLHQIRAWSSEDKTQALSLWKALGFTLSPAVEHHPSVEVRGFFATRLLEDRTER